MAQIEILFNGFSGKMSNCALGWGTVCLIRNGGKNILVDVGGAGVRNYLPGLLNEKGLNCADIDYVLLTHLHFDHSYNVDLFKNAEIFLSKEEWEYSINPLTRDNYTDLFAINYLAEKNLHFVFDNENVLPNITAIHTPGHTPGCVSYVVKMEDGEIWTIAGDAAKNRGELANEEVQMTIDPENTIKSIRRIKSLSNRVLPGHDSWISIENGKVIPLSKNSKKLLFGQGITVNGGLTELEITMD